MPVRIDMKRIAELRGHVVHRFAGLESSIDNVIALYYLRGDVSQEFWDDVMSDEHFSFALRRSLFEKLLRREGWHDRKKIELFHEVSRLRNLMGHMGKMFIGADGVHGFVNPRDPSKPLLDPEVLAKDFNAAFAQVEPYVTSLILKVRHKFYPPGGFKEEDPDAAPGRRKKLIVARPKAKSGDR